MEPSLDLLFGCLINVIQFVLTVLWNVPALTESNVIFHVWSTLKGYEPDFLKQWNSVLSLFTPLLAVVPWLVFIGLSSGCVKKELCFVFLTAKLPCCIADNMRSTVNLSSIIHHLWLIRLYTTDILSCNDYLYRICSYTIWYKLCKYL